MLLRSVMTHVRNQNWLGVILDFLIVVIGIWIALLITQWSDKQQRLAELDRAESQLNDQLVYVSFYLSERLAVAPCRRERYATLGELLRSPDNRWPGFAPEIDEWEQRRALPSVLRTPSRPFNSGLWELLQRQGDLDEMAHERKLVYTGLFATLKMIDQMTSAIKGAESRLQILRYPAEISTSDRRRYYSELSEADSLNAVVEFAAEQQLRRIEEYELVSFTQAQRRELQDYAEEMRLFYERRFPGCPVKFEMPLLEDTATR